MNDRFAVIIETNSLFTYPDGSYTAAGAAHVFDVETWSHLFKLTNPVSGHQISATLAAGGQRAQRAVTFAEALTAEEVPDPANGQGNENSGGISWPKWLNS
jgi:hypothetical protein